MYRMHKSSIIFFLFIGLPIIFNSCRSQEKQFRHDELISVPSVDTSIMVKISYPDGLESDKIIIWSFPPLTDKFIPDSVDNPKFLSIDPVLRKALLSSGYINIEYLGRSDSISYLGRKYRASDSNSKAIDLGNLLNYIQTDENLKNKKIILIGFSEGGDVNVKVASEWQSEISAMVQLACGALSGEELVRYQGETQFFDRFLKITCHGHQENMDKTTNRASSLDSYHTADMEGKGARQFIKENFDPLDSIIFQYQNIDSVYIHIDSYLCSRWKKEDRDTKDFWENDFERYYQYFAGEMTPQQIALKTNQPGKYLSSIKCPILAVHGTEDERIDCYPNIEKMEQLLTLGGNEKFQKIILKEYKHNLAKWNGEGYSVENEIIEQIIEWINEQ